MMMLSDDIFIGRVLRRAKTDLLAGHLPRNMP